MEEAFRAVLTSASAVTALVPASRINWGSHPQGEGLPGVVLTVVSGAEGLTQQGPDGLELGRVQVDCYGVTFSSARDIARAIKDRLHGYSGGAFQLIRHDTTQDSREGGSNEAERPHRFRLDFLTSWRAT